LQAQQRVGWQPSRFLTDRAKAERAFQLAEQLGSINAAAAELGTIWPSLPKVFTRHGLGMPTRNPEAVRQRAIAAARQRTSQPTTPTLDPVFMAFNPGDLPARERSPAELYQWVRRNEGPDGPAGQVRPMPALEDPIAAGPASSPTPCAAVPPARSPPSITASRPLDALAGGLLGT
jgi:hypothetical protein